MIPIVRNIRKDGTSDMCEGDNLRRLVSTKRPKHAKQDRPSLEAQSNWKIDYTRNTSRDVSPSSRPSAFPLLGLCLKVVPLLLPTGSSACKVPINSVHDKAAWDEFKLNDGKLFRGQIPRRFSSQTLKFCECLLLAFTNT